MFLRLLLIFIFLGFTLQSKTQFIIGLETGVHSYKMDQLRKYNESFSNYLPFENQIIDNYPSYFNYGGYFHYGGKILGFGGRYTFNSTGSRISRKDYSGEFKFDTKTKSNNLSLFLSLLIYNHKNKFSLNAYNDVGMARTTLVFDETLIISNNFNHTENTVYKATNLFIDPAIEIKYMLNVFHFNLKMGYQSDFKKDIFETIDIDKDNNKIHDQDNNEVGPDWSGLHFNMSIAINLTKLFYIPE